MLPFTVLRLLRKRIEITIEGRSPDGDCEIAYEIPSTCSVSSSNDRVMDVQGSIIYVVVAVPFESHRHRPVSDEPTLERSTLYFLGSRRLFNPLTADRICLAYSIGATLVSILHPVVTYSSNLLKEFCHSFWETFVYIYCAYYAKLFESPLCL